MSEKVEKKTAGAKLNGFMEKNRTLLITVLIVIVCLLAGYIACSVISGKQKSKNLSAIDQITYEMTSSSASLEDNEIEARRNAALEKLEAYNKKGGVVGVRANMLTADLLFQQEKYEEAAAHYEKVASLKKRDYTAPLAVYNAGVCYEQLKKLDAAEANYKKAADNKEFVLANHAKFSYGRVLEAEGKYADAVTAYNEVVNKDPDDTWAKLAKTRILTLQSEGKAE